MQHYGSILEKIVRKSGMNISEVSRKLQVSRRTLYIWFNKPNLSMSVISSVADVLEYDLSNDIPYADVQNSAFFPEFANNKKLDDDFQETKIWMNKYADLLEKYCLLLERRRRFVAF